MTTRIVLTWRDGNPEIDAMVLNAGIAPHETAVGHVTRGWMGFRSGVCKGGRTDWKRFDDDRMEAQLDVERELARFLVSIGVDEADISVLADGRLCRPGSRDVMPGTVVDGPMQSLWRELGD